jgi:peptidoglycan/xylan/chitin deacetylase (PgdA/CDA1 family)
MITGAAGAARARLRHGWQRAADALNPPPLILMYHRIAHDVIDPWQLCVSPENFAAQMACICRERRPMPLRELATALAQGRCPRNAVVVTFDDGYRDNLDAALPVLERFDVPATVFCTVDAIGRDEGFWWDRLAALLLGPQAGPDATDHYREVWSQLRPLSDAERDAKLAQIAQQRSAHTAVPPGPATMTPEQLRTLAASELIEIGAHSVTHAALSSLPIDAQRDEIVNSKAQLAQLTGREVTSFAYPFGDVGEHTAGLVRDAGFRAACTTEAAVVRADTDALLLPRLAVGNWDAAALSALWRR